MTARGSCPGATRFATAHSDSPGCTTVDVVVVPVCAVRGAASLPPRPSENATRVSARSASSTTARPRRVRRTGRGLISVLSSLIGVSLEHLFFRTCVHCLTQNPQHVEQVFGLVADRRYGAFDHRFDPTGLTKPDEHVG